MFELFRKSFLPITSTELTKEQLDFSLRKIDHVLHLFEQQYFFRSMDIGKEENKKKFFRRDAFLEIEKNVLENEIETIEELRNLKEKLKWRTMEQEDLETLNKYLIKSLKFRINLLRL